MKDADPFAFLDEPIAPTDIRNFVDYWFLDQMDADASEADVARQFAYHMIWKTEQPKKMETVRKHFIAKWGFLSNLARDYPEHFDEVLCAYAERALRFDEITTPKAAKKSQQAKNPREYIHSYGSLSS